MSAVFVCFAEADWSIAERLAGALERAGVAIVRVNGMLIEADRAAGRPEFDPESGSVAAVLVIWTPAARQSPWVRDFSRSALGYSKLVNVTAGLAAAPFPYGQAVSFSLDDWLAGQDDLSELERELRSRLAEDEPLVEDYRVVEEEARLPQSAPPPRETGSGATSVAGGDLLTSLRDMRLGAAVAGAAPLKGVAVAREPPRYSPPAEAWDEPPPMPAPSAAMPAPPPEVVAEMWEPPRPPMTAASPPRSGRAGRWALLGGGAVAAVGVLVAGVGLLTLSAPPSTGPSGPVASGPATNDAPTTPGPSPVQALAQTAVGRWATKACDRAAEISISDGQLTLRLPDGTTETGVIMADTADTFAVETAGGAVTYTVAGDVLTKSGGANGPVTFTRCPASVSNAADNAVGNTAAQAALVAMAVAGAGAGAATPPAGPAPIADEVDVSAFSPRELRAGEAALVQIYLHPVDQADVAEARAQAADPQTTPRGQTTLDLELPRGTRVDVILDGGGLTVDEPVQAVVWRGRACACQFEVSAPERLTLGAKTLTARLLVGGVPVGRLSFRLSVVGAAEPADSARGLRDNAAKRYQRAFLSYSSLDRPEVLKSAQALHAAGIGYFQDILSIEPGEAWRERLFAEIDRCDLFLLFWSSHAAASDWVRDEVEYALKRRGASPQATPDITPVIIEGPPIPQPPPSLASLHFNDMLRYVVVASELEARARQAAD